MTIELYRVCCQTSRKESHGNYCTSRDEEVTKNIPIDTKKNSYEKSLGTPFSLLHLKDQQQEGFFEYRDYMISSKTLRAERRAKKIKKVVGIIENSLLYGFFALVAIAMLWIIQVGVTSI